MSLSSLATFSVSKLSSAAGMSCHDSAAQRRAAQHSIAQLFAHSPCPRGTLHEVYSTDQQLMQAKVSRQISCEESWLRLLAWELTPIMQHLHHSKLHSSKPAALYTSYGTLYFTCDLYVCLCVCLCVCLRV